MSSLKLNPKTKRRTPSKSIIKEFKSIDSNNFFSIINQLSNLNIYEEKHEIKTLLENLKDYKKNEKMFKRDNKLALILEKQFKDKKGKVSLFNFVYALVNNELYVYKMMKPYLIYFGNTTEINFDENRIRRILSLFEQDNDYFAMIKDGNNKQRILKLEKV